MRSLQVIGASGQPAVTLATSRAVRGPSARPPPGSTLGAVRQQVTADVAHVPPRVDIGGHRLAAGRDLDLAGRAVRPRGAEGLGFIAARPSSISIGVSLRAIPIAQVGANFNSTLAIVIARACTSRRPVEARRPSSSWRVEPSPPATWTVEECTIGDFVSVRPYRGSFEPVGVAHPVTSHIEPLAAQARPGRSGGHRVKHDTRVHLGERYVAQLLV